MRSRIKRRVKKTVAKIKGAAKEDETEKENREDRNIFFLPKFMHWFAINTKLKWITFTSLIFVLLPKAFAIPQLAFVAPQNFANGMFFAALIASAAIIISARRIDIRFDARRKIKAAAVVFVFLFLAAPALAIPQLINLQGKLTDENNLLLSGQYNFDFRLYDAASGGTLEWNESKALNVTNGVFSTLLGGTKPINLTFDKDLWLEVQVNSEVLQPRFQVGSTAYAFRANVTQLAIADTPTDIPFTIRGAESQSADLFVVENSSGSDLLTVDNNGNLNITGTYYGDGSGLIGIIATSNIWNRSGNNIFPVTLSDNVGIGTASPLTNLDVTDSGGWSGVLVRTDGDSYGSGVYLRRPSIEWQMEQRTDSNFHIRENTTGTQTTRFIVENGTGNVGIGTTSPYNKLTINGSDDSVHINIVNNQANSMSQLVIDNDAQSWAVRLDNDDKFKIRDVTAATDRLTIDTSGNVGIGTTSPERALHISTSANSDIRLETNSDSDNPVIEVKDNSPSQERIGAINFLDSADQANGQVAYQFETDLLQFRTSATDRLVIDTNGSVGIGTTSPQTDFHVHRGGTEFSPHPSTIMMIQNTSIESAGAIFTIIGGTKGNSQIVFGDNESEFQGRIVYSNNIEALRLYSNASERVRIDGLGNVGIGTTSPEEKLHISGTGNILPLIESTDNNAVQLRLKSDSTNRRIIAQNSSDGVQTQIIFGDNGKIQFVGTTTDQTPFTIDGGAPDDSLWLASSGNLGINMTSPQSLLHVLGEDVKLLFESVDTTASSAGIVGEAVDNRVNYIGYTSNNTFTGATSLGGIQMRITDVDPNPLKSKMRLLVNTGDTLTEAMTILDDGNVGIGTSSPTYPLTVESASTSINIFANGTSSALLLEDHNAAANQKFVQLLDSAGVFTIRGLNDTLASPINGLSMDLSNGFIGINTTSPDTILHIIGPRDNVNGQLKIESDDIDARIELWNGDGQTTTGRASILMSKYTGYEGLRFMINNSDKMIIDENGNVGIGTTNPSYRLDIPNSSTSHNYGTPIVNIGYDGGGGASEGNLKIGNYQLFVSASEVATNDDATEALVIQTGDNPTTAGYYQLLSVQSSGNANRFSVIHGGEAGYASQFYDSVAIGASGYTNCTAIGVSSIDCGTGGGGDLYVKDDIEYDGVLYAPGADLAEHVPTTEVLDPGTVVELDKEAEEHVRKTTEPYSTLVVGVISSDPALILGKDDEGQPLALSGRAPVKVNEENGPIEIGDYLVSSSTPGEAMGCRLKDIDLEAPVEERWQTIKDNEQCKNAAFAKAMTRSWKGLVTGLVILN